ncbi:hypothetical protein ACGFI9_25190 [Micromonospora sp. NPDC048930]|uniref:hypothetical protein n=1 Tax=Micromonospora sp. NPDC048930 TaxID=3364261 RepID=UPI00371CC325
MRDLGEFFSSTFSDHAGGRSGRTAGGHRGGRAETERGDGDMTLVRSDVRQGTAWSGRTATLPVLDPAPDAAIHRTTAATASNGKVLHGLRPWLPLLVALAWMLGTFGAFWLGGQADEVPDPARLCLFVLSATTVFALGYVARIVLRPPQARPADDTPQRMRRIHRLVFWGAWYYAALGAALLLEYGANSPGDILRSIMDPADSYASKFAIYQAQQDSGRVSLPIQVLTLLAVLSTATVPLLAVHWRGLTPRLKTTALLGISVYIVFFLYIGTLKGLGDTVVMALAGLMVASVARLRIRRRRPTRRGVLVAVVLLAVFGWYMVGNQAARVSLFGTQDVMRANPAVARVVGNEAATGVAATIFYPTHGYLGLAYNLETPFEWSRGLGANPAVASYAGQYLKADVTEHPPYPTRTEARTGYPAGLYWSTAYPWLASDLTFPGVVALMGLLGWFLARFWTEAAYHREILPTLIFAQLALVIAYLPANNQLGASRPGLIGLVTLAVLYAATRVNRRARALRSAEPT